jgi:MFS family permease
VSVRHLSFGLSRQIWIVEIGVFLNMLGYGAVLPFEIIYLHDGRGFDLGVAGLVVGLVTGIAVVASPIAGAAIDRIGARATAVAGGLSLAAGYAGLAFAESPPAACAAAALAGIGNGALSPSQSALMTALAPRELRHRASAISRIAVNVGIGLGGAIGGLVAGFGLRGFVGLLLANAATYVVYVAILVATVREDVRVPSVGGYRRVLRDRAFVHFAVTNIALIAVGWGVLAWIVPPFAEGLGIAPGLIGLLFLANAATVVLAQVPIVKAVEGRSRVGALVLGAAAWVGACLLALLAQGAEPTVAYGCLIAAAIAFGLGECLHATVLLPLVADLAPLELRGRYMASIGLSWWLGLALAPTVGDPLLAVSASLALLVAAALSGAAILSLLALGARLPVGLRLIPRPQTAPVPRPLLRRGE